MSNSIMYPTMPDSGYGNRPDGTRKGKGYLGELKLPTGGVATEYSIGVEMEGQEVQIPTIVPTLTKGEINMLVTDIIPNGKKVPEEIVRKAVQHARRRMLENKSPFAD